MEKLFIGIDFSTSSFDLQPYINKAKKGFCRMGHAEGNDIQNIYMHLSDEDIVREMLEKWVV
jgi:hypothetical protein